MSANNGKILSLPYFDPILHDILSAKREVPASESAIQSALSREGFAKACRALQDGDAVDYMMYILQQYLDTTARGDPKNTSRNIAFKTLNSLARRRRKLTSIPLIHIAGDCKEVARGGFGLISKATYNGGIVAIKEVICYAVQDNVKNEKNEKLFLREILMWRQLTQLKHPNILPLIGITSSRLPDLKIVAPWQENGSLRDYVKQPQAARINRLRLLAQTCSGVMFLHNHVPLVIHADLKCANVLVQEDGTPCLADFGLATVRHNGATLTSVLNGTGTVRWMAQELFQHEDSESDAPLKVTQYSDIWSFGMLALELLTEQVPFAEKVLDTTVMYGLMKGDRPEQPGFDAVRRGLGNELWNHLRRCWEVTPENRPPLKSLLSLLERLAARWTPTPSVEQKSHYTVEVNVSAPPEIRREIIGMRGANIRQFESTLHVKIEVGEVDIKISGMKADVNEARSRIEDLAARQANQTKQCISVPGHLLPYLIGTGGERIRQFEKKHLVKVTFSDDQARVVGPSKNVNEAIEELCQTVDLDKKEWSSKCKLAVSPRVASRLQTGRVVESAKLDISPANHSDGRRVVTLSAQSSGVLDRAVKEIQELDEKLSKEPIERLNIPPQFHGLVLGSKWKRWGDLVVDCGGPTDPNLQKDMIDIKPSSPEVTLRGDSRVIGALAKKIQKIVDGKNENVYGISIPPEYHKTLRGKLQDVQRRTGTSIILPGYGRYSELVGPINANELRGKDVACIVKIIGTYKAYKNACHELDVYIDELGETICTMPILSKYQHAIFGWSHRKLKEMEVRIISPSINSSPEITPVRQPPKSNPDISWEVIARYDNNTTGVCQWTVQAKSRKNLVKAQTLIKEALEEVRRARRVGFLTFPDKTKFGRIVGPRGENLAILERDTKTTIQVPHKDAEDTTVVITGASGNLEDARRRILEMVNPVNVRSTDRLFNSSKLSSPLPSQPSFSSGSLNYNSGIRRG